MSVSNSTAGEEEADEGVADLLLQEEDTGVIELGIPLIPVDLFVRKRKKKKLTFTDTFNNVVFQAAAGLLSDRRGGRFLLDSSGRPIIFILPDPGGSWRAFKGNSGANEDLLFTVERSLNTFSRIELNVLLVEQNRGDSAAVFKVKGSVFWRSFCIYREDSILAQSSLMYKLGLGKVFVSRSKFRVTMFPGFSNQAFIACLVLIFLDGRK